MSASSNGSSGAHAQRVDLARVSPARLLFALLHQRFTGALAIEQAPPHAGDRTIWFVGGMPVFTDWVDPSAVLGQVLLDLGFVGEDALWQALVEMRDSEQRLGQVLIRGGQISEAQLAAGLNKQCELKLTHFFALQNGTLHMLPGEHPHASLKKVNSLALILSGVTSYYDDNRIEAELGSGLQERCIATAAFVRYRAQFSFRAADNMALDAMITGTSLRRLVADGFPERRAKRLFYTLWACQMLRVGEAVSSNEPAQARPKPKAPAAPSASSSRPLAPPPPPRVPPPPPRAQVRAQAQAKAPAVAPSPPRPASSPPPGAANPSPARPPGDASTSPIRASSPTASPGPSSSSSPPPSASSPRDAPAEAEFVADLVEREAAIERGAHAFELLGLEFTADRKDIRRAWGDLSRRLHPDALQSKGLGHLKTRVGKVFAALSEAHALLGDKEQREHLRQKLERGEDPHAEQDATSLARAALESDIIAREADRFLKANRFDRAKELYEKALTYTPDEPDLIAAIAWSRYCLSARQREDAIAADKALVDVVENYPRLARAHYFRGMVLRDMGAAVMAVRAFEQAIKQDPRLIDAERQARAIRATQRQAAGGEKPKKGRGIRGLFSK